MPIQKASLRTPEAESNTLKKVIMAISLLGAIGQLCDVTTTYQKYEVLTEVQYLYEGTRVLPSVTIGLLLLQFVDYHKMVEKYPKESEKFHQAFPEVKTSEEFRIAMKKYDARSYMYHSLLKNLSIVEIRNIIHDADYLITKLWLPNLGKFGHLSPEETARQCKKVLYFKEKFVMININCNSEREYQVHIQDYERGFDDLALLTIDVNSTLLKEMSVTNLYLHPPNTLLFRNQNPSVIVQSSTHSKTYAFNYRVYRNTLLPPPYKTNCRDYTLDGYISQLHAIETCENQRSLRLLNCPYNNNIYKSDIRGQHSASAYFWDLTKERTPKERQVQEYMTTITWACVEEFNQIDCKSVSYVPSYIYSYDRFDEQSQILIQWPSLPDVVVACSPKFTFTNYLVFVGSVFSTWLGFNVAFTFPHILQPLVVAVVKLQRQRSSVVSQVGLPSVRRVRLSF